MPDSNGSPNEQGNDVTYRQVRHGHALPAAANHRAAPTTCAPSLSSLLQYKGATDLALVMGLIDNELSEPYSIFTYRWGQPP